MYDIFQSSIKYYLSTVESDKSSYRYKIGVPIELMGDYDAYIKGKENSDERYYLLSDLLQYLSKNIDRYPRLKAFLWNLEGRGFEIKHYGIAKDTDLEEQCKLLDMIVKLAYWH